MAEGNSWSLSSVHTIKQFSDLTLICGDESFKTHKACLCRHSPVIAAALTGESIEAKTYKMVISFDLPTVKRIIDFMYMGDYDLSTYTASDILSSDCIAEQGVTTDGVGKEIASGNADSGADDVDSKGVDSGEVISEDSHPIRKQLIQHGLMNSIADYYAIPALGALAIEKTTRILTDNWSGTDFCDFVRESIGSIRDARFHKMLSDIVMDHLSDVLKDCLLDNIDVAQVLSPHLLVRCCTSLADSRKLLDSTSAKAITASGRLAHCRSLLERRQYCKMTNCDGQFDVFIDHEYIPCCRKCLYRQEY
ncbi:hypothetical protein EV127DRAFT_515518 [Xylaria flabelliformis]|nr:hypothetical protein EV127DRAFT_515518 [Xylaria flabelliformis]